MYIQHIFFFLPSPFSLLVYIGHVCLQFSPQATEYQCDIMAELQEKCLSPTHFWNQQLMKRWIFPLGKWIIIAQVTDV